MARWKRFIYAVIALFSLQPTARAQEAETFVHTIKQGETVYSIARTYQVSPESILKLNPAASTGIKAGETLAIPQQQNGVQEKRFHTIQAGETLYKLTKTYRTSADEICKANPGLTAENFKAGMVIRIPVSTMPVNTAPAKESTQPQGVAQSGCREMHKVKRKETLYSIARNYNLTEAELKAANPEMNEPDYKLRKGDFVCIPFPKAQKPEEIIPTNEELMRGKAAAAPQRMIRVGVILPFKGGAAENGKMVEFYRGVLMAVEETKKSGTSVDVFAYDSGKTAADIKAVLSAHTLENMDFIVGPLYQEQITLLGKFCQQHHVRLVVPFSSFGDDVYENPYYFAVNPPKSYRFAEASRLTAEIFGKDNIVFLESEENDKDAAVFVDAVRKRLERNGNVVRCVKTDDDDQKWVKVMSQEKNNVIIPNSSDIRLLNLLFPKLKEFCEKHSGYAIKLVGYPEWQTYTDSHLENFYKFDTYAYTSFYMNPLNGKADGFESAYRKAFRAPTIVSWPRFGMLGYDTAMYFLEGISTYGEDFDRHLPQITATPYQHRFDFRRVSNWGGFINQEVEFIHYSPSHSIELIRLKK